MHLSLSRRKPKDKNTLLLFPERSKQHIKKKKPVQNTPRGAKRNKKREKKGGKKTKKTHLSSEGGREAHWCYWRGKEEETDGIMLLMLYNNTTTTTNTTTITSNSSKRTNFQKLVWDCQKKTQQELFRKKRMRKGENSWPQNLAKRWKKKLHPRPPLPSLPHFLSVSLLCVSLLCLSLSFCCVWGCAIAAFFAFSLCFFGLANTEPKSCMY